MRVEFLLQIIGFGFIFTETKLGSDRLHEIENSHGANLPVVAKLLMRRIKYQNQR
jgi:hypothetical protein